MTNNQNNQSNLAEGNQGAETERTLVLTDPSRHNMAEQEGGANDNMLAVIDHEGETYSSQYPGVRVTNRGLLLPNEMTFEAWSEFGQRLIKAEEKIQFLLGDWFNFGTEKWGEEAYSMFDGFQYETIINMGRVAREFVDPAASHHVVGDEIVLGGVASKPFRREKLTWSHHREVLAVKEVGLRTELLDRAEAENLTVRQLKQEVYQLKSVQGIAGLPYDAQASDDEFIDEWGDKAFANGVDTVQDTIHHLCDPTYEGSTRIVSIIVARHQAALKDKPQVEAGTER